MNTDKPNADDLLKFVSGVLSIGKKVDNGYIIQFPEGKAIAFLEKEFTDIQFGTKNENWYRPDKTLVVPLPDGMKNVKVFGIYVDCSPNAIFTAYNILPTEIGLPIWVYINSQMKLNTVVVRIIVTGDYQSGGNKVKRLIHRIRKAVAA